MFLLFIHTYIAARAELLIKRRTIPLKKSFKIHNNWNEYFRWIEWNEWREMNRKENAWYNLSLTKLRKLFIHNSLLLGFKWIFLSSGLLQSACSIIELALIESEIDGDFEVLQVTHYHSNFVHSAISNISALNLNYSQIRGDCLLRSEGISAS